MRFLCALFILLIGVVILIGMSTGKLTVTDLTGIGFILTGVALLVTPELITRIRGNL